jgi:hypothetical protein
MTGIQVGANGAATFLFAIREYAKSVFFAVKVSCGGSVSPLCWKLSSKTSWKCHLLEVDFKVLPQSTSSRFEFEEWITGL